MERTPRQNRHVIRLNPNPTSMAPAMTVVLKRPFKTKFLLKDQKTGRVKTRKKQTTIPLARGGGKAQIRQTPRRLSVPGVQ